MYLCYIDESGTPDIPGNTSHYVLAGLAVPIKNWKSCDQQVYSIKKKYGLEKSEIHVAWILRPYLEQGRIADFDQLDYIQRVSQVQTLRNAELLRLQRTGNSKLYRQTRKNYQKTEAYVHLSYGERNRFISEVAQTVSQWGFARLFAECVDKIHFDPIRTSTTIDEQAFEQIVSRFEKFLQTTSTKRKKVYGLLIHDNNETVAHRHTELMKRFHQRGTLWTQVEHIIETPLFVNSQLTSLVQISDVCGYVLRRYLENDEAELFDLIFQRADRKDKLVVGVRHFTKPSCSCKICDSRRQARTP
jgi:hypothetical protein